MIYNNSNTSLPKSPQTSAPPSFAMMTAKTTSTNNKSLPKRPPQAECLNQTQEQNQFKRFYIVIRTKIGAPKPFEKMTPQEAFNKINKVLIEINANCKNIPIRIKAFTRYPSGDIKLYTKSRAKAQWLLQNRAGWKHRADPLFVTSPPNFPIIVHFCPSSSPNPQRRVNFRWELHENDGIHPGATSMLQIPKDRPPSIPMQGHPNMLKVWQHTPATRLQRFGIHPTHQEVRALRKPRNLGSINTTGSCWHRITPTVNPKTIEEMPRTCIYINKYFKPVATNQGLTTNTNVYHDGLQSTPPTLDPPGYNNTHSQAKDLLKESGKKGFHLISPKHTPTFLGSKGRPTTIDLTWENHISKNLLPAVQIQLNNHSSDHYPILKKFTPPNSRPRHPPKHLSMHIDKLQPSTFLEDL
ncbi:hypothetical protein O181_018166 [Austropuccinia psidii MF-1]|uniref:Endonuclease/exonuclease/phosphatase domain-containing protein n=1 Tax=Austropuccinia psidii MF-1 TaxID=1389203 RepID=A0A9Q3GSN9_9BASI|nr:hypothetical protein [Austropuccinia psidii MF-1]